MLTIPQAKTLVQNSLIFDAARENADGSPKRYRVTSVKTWKTRPDHVRVNLRYGLKQHFSIDHDDKNHLITLCVSEAEAIEQREMVQRYIKELCLDSTTYNANRHFAALAESTGISDYISRYNHNVN
jgi:hypothetical protein